MYTFAGRDSVHLFEVFLSPLPKIADMMHVATKIASTDPLVILYHKARYSCSPDGYYRREAKYLLSLVAMGTYVPI